MDKIINNKYSLQSKCQDQSYEEGRRPTRRIINKSSSKLVLVVKILAENEKKAKKDRLESIEPRTNPVRPVGAILLAKTLLVPVRYSVSSS
jgi:hypothetical protein